MIGRLVVALSCASACGHPSAPVRPAAPDAWARSGIDWDQLPAVGPDAPFTPPHIDDIVLPNGLRLIVVENPRLPIVSIATIHLAAGSREDGAQFGLAALTADALDEGAGGRDADAFADALERAGARLDTDIASDYASTHTTTLAAHLDETLGLVADVVRRPRLAARDVARLAQARVTELAARDARPRTLAALAFDRLIFGGHPYGHPAEGDRATVGALGASDVRAFWERAYGPTSTTIIVVGGVGAKVVQTAVRAAFDDWAVLDMPATAPRGPLAPGPPVLTYIDRPGATETAIVVGRLATSSGGDRLAADVANVVLGGGQGSRLERRLVGELHVTSAAAASFWRGQLGASWSIATATSTANTAKTVREVLGLVAAARATDPSAEELARAKTQLLRAIPIAFETTTGVARALERLVVQQRPLDSFSGYRDRIELVTATAARAAIATAWDQLSIVVVGDWSVFGAELASLGLPTIRIP